MGDPQSGQGEGAAPPQGLLVPFVTPLRPPALLCHVPKGSTHAPHRTHTRTHAHTHVHMHTHIHTPRVYTTHACMHTRSELCVLRQQGLSMKNADAEVAKPRFLAHLCYPQLCDLERVTNLPVLASSW